MKDQFIGRVPADWRYFKSKDNRNLLPTSFPNALSIEDIYAIADHAEAIGVTLTLTQISVLKKLRKVPYRIK